MIICAAGDIHGALDRLYEDVLAFEESLGVCFEWVLHVGDFGVWSDPNRIDGATKRHDGAGDFPAWCAERRKAPRKTLFIKGNHEDFVWLDAKPDSEVLPNLFYPSCPKTRSSPASGRYPLGHAESPLNSLCRAGRRSCAHHRMFVAPDVLRPGG